MRAPRFFLHLPLKYRRVGDEAWHLGETENISHSGVLFRTDDSFEVNTPVELRVRLTTAPAPGEAGEVCCRGRVVRTVSPWENTGRPGAAVLIEQYDFQLPTSFSSLES